MKKKNNYGMDESGIDNNTRIAKYDIIANKMLTIQMGKTVLCRYPSPKGLKLPSAE
jgi:hypothetical protein